MNKKIATGAFLALAIGAGSVANVAAAQGIGANADVSVKAESNHGIRGMLSGFFGGKHDDNKDNKDIKIHEDKNVDRTGNDDRHLDDRMGLTFGIGTVTAVDGDTITATSKKDDTITWTVNTDNNTTFTYRGNDTLDVGDRIAVGGMVTDNDGDARSIDAKYVLVVDANIALAQGTITDVDEDSNTVTVATKHQGDVTVAVDSSTDITGKGNEDGVFSDLIVGAKVRVHGVWNSLRDMVTATKIRIAAHL